MPPLMAARSTPSPATTLRLLRRQTLVPLPPYYPYTAGSLPPGTIVGIVLGSVAGFVLLLWLLYTCIQCPSHISSEVATSVVSMRRRSKTIARERSPQRDTPVRRETVREVREVPVPVPVPVVVETQQPEEEQWERRTSQVRREEDDEVVVIEEPSSPPRRKKRRSRGRREDSGYRIVDPAAYAGGNPEEEMRRARRSRRMSGGRSAL